MYRYYFLVSFTDASVSALRALQMAMSQFQTNHKPNKANLLWIFTRNERTIDDIRIQLQARYLKAVGVYLVLITINICLNIWDTSTYDEPRA